MSFSLEMILWEMLFAAALFGAAVAASSWGQWRGLRGAWAVLFGAAAPAFFLLAMLIGANGPDGHSYYQQVRSDATSFFQAQSEALQKNGSIPPDRLETSQKLFEKLYVDLLPGWIASFCLLLGWMAFSVSNRVLSRISQKIPPPEPFRNFIIPEPLVFGVILAIGLLAAAPQFSNHDLLSVWGGCLTVFFGTLYFLGGLAVTSHFLWKWKLNPFLNFLLYSALFLTPSSVPALALLGILDLWMDFRKLKPAPELKKSGD
jgi:uncharacterized protein YybS (DUF2232 family)